MIHRSGAELSQMDPAERQKMSTDYGAFTRSFVQSGHFKAGDGLQPTTTASTVRVRDGKILAADGPFAETRKQLGGYYLDAELVDALAARDGLDGYDLLPAVRADLLRRLGRHGAAREAYLSALAMTRLEPLRRHNSRRLAQLSTEA
jgi:hypothetical protein